MIDFLRAMVKMRTVDNYRGLQIHVFEPAEEVPVWIRGDVAQGRAVVATGDFQSTATLAHILDRYIDEMLQADPRFGGRAVPPSITPRPRETRR